jgi:hypothetical protein
MSFKNIRVAVTGQLNQTFNLQKYNRQHNDKEKKNTKFIIIIASLLLLGFAYGTYKYILPFPEGDG